MNVKEIMNRATEVISASTTLKQASAKMADSGIGFLLVGENDELKGTVTDRDIVINGVAQGKDIESTSVSEVLNSNLLYCLEDQDVEEVAHNMAEQQIRRMPVVNADKRLVGVISIGDMAQHLRPETVGNVLRGVTTEKKAA